MSESRAGSAGVGRTESAVRGERVESAKRDESGARAKRDESGARGKRDDGGARDDGGEGGGRGEAEYVGDIDESDITVTTQSDADTAGTVAAAGHFRIYLGAAAGVGKTYAMLNEANRRKARGADVVIGFVECHGRQRTVDMIGDLEVISRKTVEYRGSRLTEMDLAAVLRRHPRIALIDELAHTNVPGSGPHEKRWQDVMDILAAGLDVITTVNIQHLESIADEVERMTGAKVRERVPDWVVRKADQIELVDSSPEQLRRRMLHGNIYPKAKVSRALNNFFRTDNLIALRELALRFLADETDEELLEHLRRHEAEGLWETCERLMVAVTGAPGTDALLRRAARMATRLKGELDVVHVTPTDGTQPGTGKQAIRQLQKLADDIGARWHDIRDDDPARAIANFARRNQITQIVIGSSQRSRWQQITGGGSNVTRVLREAGPLGIDVHVIALHKPPKTTLARAREAAKAEASVTGEYDRPF
jgi:two-component system, OmpR family, sensor histidine kinase KdpD